MTKLECTGTENKKRIVSEYWVKPVSRLMLLNGLEINGCCGLLTREYYIFLATHKETKHQEVITVGTYCADEFLKLTKNPPLQLSDLFNSATSHGNNSTSVERTRSNSRMHDINRLLVLGINLLCASWKKQPQSSILKILDFIYSKPEEPNYRGVIFFNDIIQRDWDKRTLTSIYESLKEGNNLKDIDFTPLHDYMIFEGKESFYK